MEIRCIDRVGSGTESLNDVGWDFFGRRDYTIKAIYSAVHSAAEEINDQLWICGGRDNWANFSKRVLCSTVSNALLKSNAYTKTCVFVSSRCVIFWSKNISAAVIVCHGEQDWMRGEPDAWVCVTGKLCITWWHASICSEERTCCVFEFLCQQ